MIKLKDILTEADVFGNSPTTSIDMPELEDAFSDIEKDCFIITRNSKINWKVC